MCEPAAIYRKKVVKEKKAGRALFWRQELESGSLDACRPVGGTVGTQRINRVKLYGGIVTGSVTFKQLIDTGSSFDVS
jgi:hypothetical protein